MRSLHWFNLTLDKQLDLDARRLEVWLTHMEPLVQKGLAKTTLYLLAGHKDIRDYFTLILAGHKDIRDYFALIAVPHPPPD